MLARWERWPRSSKLLDLRTCPVIFFTAVSYLKGALLLIQHFLGLPIYTMWLVNKSMGSADCDELSGCMNSVYFEHKRKTRTISHQECLRLAERKYRILYRTGKWTAFKNDPLSGFFVASDKDSRNHIRYEGGWGGGCDNKGGGRGDSNRLGKLTCHNYGKLGHIARNCWSYSGGTSKVTQLKNSLE